MGASREGDLSDLVLNPPPDESRYGTVVGAAFGSPTTHQYSDVVIGNVLTEWRNADAKCGRLAFLSFVVAGTFVLLAVGNPSKATVIGVATDRQGVSLVVKLLPAVFAALAAEAIVKAKMTEEYFALHQSLLHRLHPNLLWGSLNAALAPTQTSFLKGDWTWLVGRYNESRAMRWIFSFGVINRAALTIAPVGFVIYAYYVLFDRFGKRRRDRVAVASGGLGERLSVLRAPLRLMRPAMA